jgi:hypothetical protein
LHGADDGSHILLVLGGVDDAVALKLFSGAGLHLGLEYAREELEVVNTSNFVEPICVYERVSGPLGDTQKRSRDFTVVLRLRMFDTLVDIQGGSDTSLGGPRNQVLCIL